MTIQILISLLAKTTVLLALASGVAFLYRSSSAAMRHVVWSVAVFLLLLVPFVSVSLPALTLELALSDNLTEAPEDAPTRALAASTGSSNVRAKLQQDDRAVIDATVPEIVPPLQPNTTTRPTLEGMERWVLLTWVAGALVLVFTLILGVLRIYMVTRRSEVHERLQASGGHIAAELGIHHSIRIRCSAHVNVPLTWGLIRPFILLPKDAKRWTQERLRVVLLHEMAHVKRWDYLIHLVTQLALAVYWFNPLVWFAARRLGVEQERACDDLVLQSGATNHVYAQYLVDMVRAFHARGMRGAVSMAQTNMLKIRVRAILSSKIDRRPITMSSGLVTLIAMIVTTLPLTSIDVHLSSSQSGAHGASVAAAFGYHIANILPVSRGGPDNAHKMDTPEYLFIEAESGASHGAMQPYQDQDASGAQFVMSPKGPGNASSETGDYVEYDFEVRKPGPFVIWGRVLAPHARANSFFVSVDGQPEIIWDAPGPDAMHTKRIDRTAREWSWDAVSSRESNTDLVTDPIIFNLSVGNHILRIRNREHDTRLDALLLTNDLSYTPVKRTPVGPPSRPVYLWMQAEAGRLEAPMEVSEDGSARFIRVRETEESETVNTGRLSLPFEIDQPGDYVIWGRVLAPNTGANSFYVALSGGSEFIWDTPGPEDNVRAREWMWAPLRSRTDVRRGQRNALLSHLEAGTHVLQIRGREYNTLLDAVLVTNNLDFVPSGAAPASPPEYPVYVWFEAENAASISDPFRVVEDNKSSGRRYVEGYRTDTDRRDKPDTGGRAIYTVDVPVAAMYTLWGLVSIAEGGENSFWLRVDGGNWIKWNGIRKQKEWHWQRVHDSDRGDLPVLFNLDAGTHTLEIAVREYDTELDRLLLTNDMNYLPAGRGAESSTPEAEVGFEIIFAGQH